MWPTGTRTSCIAIMVPVFYLACSPTPRPTSGRATLGSSPRETSADLGLRQDASPGDALAADDPRDSSSSVDGDAREDDAAQGLTHLDWLIGRWVGKIGEVAINPSAIPSVGADLELTVTKSDERLHAVLTELTTPPSPTTKRPLAEYLIWREGPYLFLLVNEGTTPYACVPGAPGLGPNGCRSQKARRTYKFRTKHASGEYLFFESTGNPTNAYRYPVIIQFSMRKGFLEIRSAFGPQHGKTLDAYQMFERAR